MEYLIISLLLIVIILLIIVIFANKDKNRNELDVVASIGKLEVTTVKELGEFKSNINSDLNFNFNQTNEKLEKRLNQIGDKVNERLDVNFEKTNKTFNAVLTKIATINEAQKNIDKLSNDIVSLQGFLTDKKTRGIFGEVNLRNIMVNVFGENNKVFVMQHKLSNGTLADCALFAPEPLGTICIDSKFPLENYRTMVDKNNSIEARNLAEKTFKSDMKKHIDAIASKYIIPNETSNQAILFLPAEAIFAEVNAYHLDVLDYAYKKRIWITSPTTLMSTLTTIQVIIKNKQRDEYTKIIHRELNSLNAEFDRYKERWISLTKNINSVSEDVRKINITTEKITKRFDDINQVKIKE